MKVKYTVIKRDKAYGLLIQSIGTFDTIDEANEVRDHCLDTSVQNVYYEVEVIYV